MLSRREAASSGLRAHLKGPFRRAEPEPMGLLPLVKGADGRWVAGIGDPSVMGWVTVAVYFATAFLCFRASRRDRKSVV